MGANATAAKDPVAVLPERVRGTRADDAIIVSVNNLSKRFYLRAGLFAKKPLAAVSNVSFRLPKGKTVGLVGESGSGKSTLGLSLLRLHKADSGEVLFDGSDLLHMRPAQFLPYKRRMQIIFQNPYASLNPRFSVGSTSTADFPSTSKASCVCRVGSSIFRSASEIAMN